MKAAFVAVSPLFSSDYFLMDAFTNFLVIPRSKMTWGSIDKRFQDMLLMFLLLSWQHIPLFKFKCV